MTPRLNQSPHGFTLLEVVIALAILLIGVVAIMQLFPLSLTQMRIANERTTAAQDAQSSLGEVQAATADALFLGAILPGTLNFDTITATYQHHTSVHRLRGADEIYLQRVTFTVTFPDERSETFVTYVAKQ